MAITTTDGSMYDAHMSKITHCSNKLIGSFKIPATVKVIGIQAFSACSDLTSIELPHNLLQIELLAFENCKQLQSITIPSKVTAIGYQSFLNCSNLKSVRVLHEKPLMLDDQFDIFRNVDVRNCKLYVPHGSKGLYKKATLWKLFGEIVELDAYIPLKHKSALSRKQRNIMFAKSLTKLSLSRLNIFI